MNVHEELYALSAKEAARRLIGCDLVRDFEGGMLKGRIVETEAYDQTDIASHSFKGITPRNSVMFERPGLAYVYFTYGMHYCMNVVVGRKGIGAAVLIRALEPLGGLRTMRSLRNIDEISNLCSGPSKLTQALSINLSLNGHDLELKPLRLILNSPIPDRDIVWGKRIGIREEPGRELEWRAGLKGSKYLSRPL